MSSQPAALPTSVDLHLHTRASDGEHEPAELARRCLAVGLRVVACTDHNTVAALPSFESAMRASAEPVDVVSGCEITSDWRGREAHCLGYFVDVADDAFRSKLARIQEAELDRWKRWVERVGAMGFALDWPLVEQRLGVGRVPAFVELHDLLIEVAQGDPRLRDGTREALHERIERWSQPGRSLHVTPPWRPRIVEVLAWISEAGGVAVLAHPAKLVADVGAEALPELRQAGLEGLETWTTSHGRKESAWLHELCSSLDLIPTQGSDYHGVRIKPWAPGPGLLDMAAPDPLSIVASLHDRRPG